MASRGSRRGAGASASASVSVSSSSASSGAAAGGVASSRDYSMLIPVYAGNTPAVSWRKRVEPLLATVPRELRVSVLLSKLTGVAAQTVEDTPDVPTLFATLERIFPATQLQFQSLLAIKQSALQSARLFGVEFKQFRTRMGECGHVLTEVSAVDNFISALQPRLQALVKLRKPVSLDVAIEVAHDVEEALGPVSMNNGLELNLVSDNSKPATKSTDPSEWKSRRRCFKCGKIGHIAKFCRTRFLPRDLEQEQPRAKKKHATEDAINLLVDVIKQVSSDLKGQKVTSESSGCGNCSNAPVIPTLTAPNASQARNSSLKSHRTNRQEQPDGQVNTILMGSELLAVNLLVGGKDTVMIIDTGATRSVCNESPELKTTPTIARTIKVANGSVVECRRQFTTKILDHVVDFLVLPGLANRFILGLDFRLTLN